MKKNNILILSAGRRVELVQNFQTEAARFSDGIQVLATDLNPRMSPACHAADGAFSVPPIAAANYIDNIFDLARQQGIGLIIPTIDTELQKLADARSRFEAAGIHIVVSDSELVALCRDKRATAGLFERCGIATPEIYGRENLTFPCFAKPYDGSRSIGAKYIHTAEDLSYDLLKDPKTIFCQYIDITNEFTEFTVDLYYDRSGRLKCAVPRERLEVRSGEVSKGATRRNGLYTLLAGKMAHLEGARGCITAQFFYNGSTLYGIEINPRFGGGFPLTYAAGGNYPGWLISEYLYGGAIPFFDQWENNLIMLRYDAKVLVHE
ncbi:MULTISPECIES: ATP-grasp domain-containing protein [unclassified Neisseria]|uniref:ATP-grasp domain-containing protein n=1 Tax=unclassified Neisseria TaxID=2623750 RepID=UPI00107196AA|nr:MULTISPECIES: ATP-grasp domain-containing protein [unclassified Neisseria]MBF0803996.1 ATP-grasp domain-containing protein [Neisseria sp. 19428wB4_WF04]TFU43267.1 ATP-grasp domain-containing protein [Neisseria sp. WF04]